MHNTTYKAI